MASIPEETIALMESTPEDTHRNDDYLDYQIKNWLAKNGLGSLAKDEDKFKAVKEMITKFKVDLNSEGNTIKNLIGLMHIDEDERADEEARVKAYRELYKHTEDPSTFAGKKTLMAGFLDLSLLFANGVHIRDMTDRGDKEWYIWVNIGLVILIMALQVVMAGCLAFVYATNIYKFPLKKDDAWRRRLAVNMNTAVLFITLLITIIHVIAISLFWKERESGTDISEVIHLLKQYQNNTYG